MSFVFTNKHNNLKRSCSGEYVFNVMGSGWNANVSSARHTDGVDQEEFYIIGMKRIGRYTTDFEIRVYNGVYNDHFIDDLFNKIHKVEQSQKDWRTVELPSLIDGMLAFVIAFMDTKAFSDLLTYFYNDGLNAGKRHIQSQVKDLLDIKGSF
jgi:hypothetical protein